MMIATRGRRRQAFVLIAAIGTLAVLMIVAFTAASSSQFTLAFSMERLRDRRAGDHLAEAARALAKINSETSRTVRLITPPPNVPTGMIVTATVGLPADAKILGPAIGVVDGDRFAVVEARRQDGVGTKRRSTFLTNTKGLRPSPILIREERF